MGAPNVFACLSRCGVGVSCLEFVRVGLSSFVLASVGAPCCFGSLLRLDVIMGAVCVGLAMLL
jgi:hypothetical protein